MAYPGNMIAEASRVGCEEAPGLDSFEALEALLAEQESGFYPTPDEEEEVRLFAGYGVDNAALCIEEGPDTTEGGQVIPEWAFN
jgi:hypothetical protein